MKKIVTLALGLALLGGGALAQAGPDCRTTQAMGEFIASFGEVPVMTMIDGAGATVAIWVDPLDTSWTLTVERSEAPGVLCMMASGFGVAFSETFRPVRGTPA